jgi:D-lactate dehydrogenase
MALLYFYDASDLDRQHLTQALQSTDHHWEYVEGKLSLDNINPEAEVVSLFVTSEITREMIERMPKLRLIACRSTGFNNVDLAAAEERDIKVVNVPTYGEATVAEYAFTLTTALLRKLPAVLEAETEDVDQHQLLGSDLHGKTLGVIGTGHIGQYAIKIGNGYSMHVVGYDAFPNDNLQESLNFTYTSLEDLMAQSDVITIHAPYLPSTHHLITANLLSLMKPSAIIVNTARGEIIDTAALVNALETGQIGGAALDVVEGEALLNHHEEVALLRSNQIAPELLRHSVEISVLKKMPNVIISPHNAFNTIEAIKRINGTTAENIIKFWFDEMPNRVKPQEKQTGKLIVIRHAESEWNATGRWSGIRDVHLSEKGFHESTLLGFEFKKLQISLDVAYCSEQIRTRETMEGILNTAQYFDVDINRESALNERDYGDYTGKNKWEMRDILGEQAFNELRRGWDVPVPNGESLKKVYERVVPFYESELLPQLLSGKNVLIVAHGNSIRALMKYIESIGNEQIGSLEMLFGQIIVYDVDDKGKMKSKSVTTIDSTPPNA